MIRQKAITQEETAKVCSISINTLRGWMCKGIIPPLSDAFCLAQYLGVSLEYLISGNGNDKSSKNVERALVLLEKADLKLKEIRRKI